MTIIHPPADDRIRDIALEWLRIAGLNEWQDKRILFTKLWSAAVGSPQDADRLENTIIQLEKLDGRKIEVQEVLIWTAKMRSLMKNQSEQQHG